MHAPTVTGTGLFETWGVLIYVQIRVLGCFGVVDEFSFDILFCTPPYPLHVGRCSNPLDIPKEFFVCIHCAVTYLLLAMCALPCVSGNLGGLVSYGRAFPDSIRAEIHNECFLFWTCCPLIALA